MLDVVRFTRRVAAIAAVSAIVIAPGVAQAQSCYDLAQDREDVNNDIVQLLEDHPGVHTVVAICAAQAQNSNASSDDKAAAFLLCVGGSCLFVGVSNCVDTAQRWYALSQKMDRIERFERNKGCPK